MEEQVKIKAQQNRKLARYMSSTADLVENQIMKAQERGEFENLTGQGKPLRFEENPYEAPELRMIFKILKTMTALHTGSNWARISMRILKSTGKKWKNSRNMP